MSVYVIMRHHSLLADASSAGRYKTPQPQSDREMMEDGRRRQRLEEEDCRKK